MNSLDVSGEEEETDEAEDIVALLVADETVALLGELEDTCANAGRLSPALIASAMAGKSFFMAKRGK